jgi:hypothetical protein
MRVLINTLAPRSGEQQIPWGEKIKGMRIQKGKGHHQQA